MTLTRMTEDLDSTLTGHNLDKETVSGVLQDIFDQNPDEPVQFSLRTEADRVGRACMSEPGRAAWESAVRELFDFAVVAPRTGEDWRRDAKAVMNLQT